MADWADQKHSLNIRLYHSISGKYSFLETKFRGMTRSAIFARIGSDLLSVCIHVILKPRCRYILLNCLITSSMLFNIRFLIIFPAANIMCLYMVFRNPMPLMCMRSHNWVNFLYPSREPLGIFGNMIGSTNWNLWRTVFPCKCVTLGPYY